MRSTFGGTMAAASRVSRCTPTPAATAPGRGRATAARRGVSSRNVNRKKAESTAIPPRTSSGAQPGDRPGMNPAITIVLPRMTMAPTSQPKATSLAVSPRPGICQARADVLDAAHHAERCPHQAEEAEHRGGGPAVLGGLQPVEEEVGAPPR